MAASQWPLWHCSYPWSVISGAALVVWILRVTGCQSCFALNLLTKLIDYNVRKMSENSENYPSAESALRLSSASALETFHIAYIALHILISYYSFCPDNSSESGSCLSSGSVWLWHTYIVYYYVRTFMKKSNTKNDKIESKEYKGILVCNITHIGLIQIKILSISIFFPANLTPNLTVWNICLCCKAVIVITQTLLARLWCHRLWHPSSCCSLLPVLKLTLTVCMVWYLWLSM